MFRRLPHAETVTRLRVVPVTDAWGNETPGDWATADRLTVDNCALVPNTQAEAIDDNRDSITDGWTLYVPGRQVDIGPNDRIEHPRYGTFDVDGQPNQWHSPYSGDEATTVKLKRTEG